MVRNLGMTCLILTLRPIFTCGAAALSQWARKRLAMAEGCLSGNRSQPIIFWPSKLRISDQSRATARDSHIKVLASTDVVWPAAQ